MASRCVAFVVVGDKATVVDTHIPNKAEEPVTIISDDTWTLQEGDRGQAYDAMYRRCINYLTNNQIAEVIVKSSALTIGATKLAHLISAELRGVIIAASASVATVSTVSKAHISRTYGSRKLDEYIADDEFWDEMTTGGALRKSSREGAMLVMAMRNR